MLRKHLQQFFLVTQPVKPRPKSNCDKCFQSLALLSQNERNQGHNFTEFSLHYVENI